MTTLMLFHRLFGWRAEIAQGAIKRPEFWRRFLAMWFAFVFVQLLWFLVLKETVGTMAFRDGDIALDNLVGFFLVLFSIIFGSLHFQPFIAGRFMDLGISEQWPRHAHRLALGALLLAVFAVCLRIAGSNFAIHLTAIAFLLAFPSHAVLTFGIVAGVLPSQKRTAVGEDSA